VHVITVTSLDAGVLLKALRGRFDLKHHHAFCHYADGVTILKALRGWFDLKHHCCQRGCHARLWQTTLWVQSCYQLHIHYGRARVECLLLFVWSGRFAIDVIH
jgi:hypothetical protein